MAWIYGLQAATLAAIAWLTYTNRRIIMALQDVVDQITEELALAHGRIQAEIAKVQAQLEAAQVPVEEVDLSALQAEADLLAGIVPAEPTEPEGDVDIAKRDNTDDK